MTVLSDFEKMAIEKGIQQGIKENLRSNIIALLEKRFENIPSELINTINQMQDTNKLQTLLLETISINSLSDFQSLINN
jgi:hypothetical protein